MGRHRLAGQRAWPMDPAKKAGNKEPQGKQSRGEFLGWGTPGPAQILTLPCCLSLSPMLRPPARNVLGLQEARRQEKPPEWLRGHRGFPLLGCVDQVLGQSRAGQGSRGGGCRRWQQREVAILLLRLPEYPSSPHPTGWAILACRLWWAMRWARCLKLLSHSPQRKGRSPVCTRRWSSR